MNAKANSTSADECLPEPESDEILSWAEVNRTHRIRNGVYQRGGRLISLLTDFGRINPCYPDRVAESADTIYYTGNGRRGDQYLNPGNRALLAAIESGHAVPLFNKLGVGRWQHLGFWRVTAGEQIFDEQENRMLWQFRLKRTQSPTSNVQRLNSKVAELIPDFFRFDFRHWTLGIGLNFVTL